MPQMLAWPAAGDNRATRVGIVRAVQAAGCNPAGEGCVITVDVESDRPIALSVVAGVDGRAQRGWRRDKTLVVSSGSAQRRR